MRARVAHPPKAHRLTSYGGGSRYAHTTYTPGRRRENGRKTGGIKQRVPIMILHKIIIISVDFRLSTCDFASRVVEGGPDEGALGQKPGKT